MMALELEVEEELELGVVEELALGQLLVVMSKVEDYDVELEQGKTELGVEVELVVGS